MRTRNSTMSVPKADFQDNQLSQCACVHLCVNRVLGSLVP